MNPFDVGIVMFLNGFARRSVGFDRFVSLVSDNSLFKGGIIMTLIWWCWFRADNRQDVQRQHLSATVCCAFVALGAARILATTLPFRPRPTKNPFLHFLLPFSPNRIVLDSWSSFPSDHAVLFFALATGLCFVSRKLGACALGYVFIAICLPRLYLGLHYPTDIIGGALLGIALACLANTERVRKAVAAPCLRWEDKSPGAFYAVFFLVSYQLAVMFNPLRDILKAMKIFLKI